MKKPNERQNKKIRRLPTQKNKYKIIVKIVQVSRFTLFYNTFMQNVPNWPTTL